MDNQKEVNNMSEGLSVADAMALNKEQGFSDQVWPLVWLAALGGGGNGLFGRGNVSEDVTVAGIDGLQNQLNNLAGIITNNSNVAQHQSVTAQLAAMSTLIQSGNSGIERAICDCCCKLNQSVCDLGFKVDSGLKDILNGICQQTQTLTMQNVTSTQQITEAVREEGRATRELINQNTLNEKDEKLADCRTQLSENRIIAALSGNGS